MNCQNDQQGDVVSARAYAMVLRSRRLRQRLLPEGILQSPYTVSDYESTLTLHDPHGAHATFARTQQVTFVQSGVSAILDHVWGDGVVMTGYQNDAGTLEDAIRDGARRHLVIGLRRGMAKGEELRFTVERNVIAGFTGEAEWLETAIDHPVKRVSAQVFFPPSRRVRAAVVMSPGGTLPLRIRQLADGRTTVRFRTDQAVAHAPYVIRWSW